MLLWTEIKFIIFFWLVIWRQEIAIITMKSTRKIWRKDTNIFGTTGCNCLWVGYGFSPQSTYNRYFRKGSFFLIVISSSILSGIGKFLAYIKWLVSKYLIFVLKAVTLTYFKKMLSDWHFSKKVARLTYFLKKICQIDTF